MLPLPQPVSLILVKNVVNLCLLFNYLTNQNVEPVFSDLGQLRNGLTFVWKVFFITFLLLLSSGGMKLEVKIVSLP